MKTSAWVGLAIVIVIAVVGFFVYQRHNLLQQAASGASCTGAGYRLYDPGSHNPYYCNDLGSTLGPNSGGECSRTGDPVLQVGFPVNGPYHVTTPVPFNVDVLRLGSGDLIVKTPSGDWAQGGRIDWGDGYGWQNVNLGLGIPLHTTHPYANAIGSTTIHVMAWAQFKYQAGPESGSYESCVDSTATLRIVP